MREKKSSLEYKIYNQDNHKIAGITLIALVITIVILIILAGVVISIALGNNGIISRVKQAEKEYKMAQYFEVINLEITEEQMERNVQEKEEKFITSLQYRLGGTPSEYVGTKHIKKDWVQDVTNNIDKILLVDTVDGYQIYIDVDNENNTAEIKSNSFMEIARNYTITYDANTGTGITESQIVREGLYVRLRKNNFTKVNDDFIGWYKNANGEGKRYEEEEIYKVTQDETFYAKWSNNAYTVTLDKQSGTSGTDSVIAIYDNSMPEITVPIRDGYTFGGYYSGTNGSGTQYYTDTGASSHNWNIASDTTLYAKWIYAYKEFYYTGSTQEFIVPSTGTYNLEVWGAQGGNSNTDSGKGGYSTGEIQLTAGEKLYVCVGGAGGEGALEGGTGAAGTGGYNGGGAGGSGGTFNGNMFAGGGGGGGATHIVRTNNDLGILKNYSSDRQLVLIVAGGGGGNSNERAGGAGGGESGSGGYTYQNSVEGGTQTTGYNFGLGGQGRNGRNSSGTAGGISDGDGGGGGGWFGGKTWTGYYSGAGGGGSGYIGGVSKGTTQNGVRLGNGFAKITYISGYTANQSSILGYVTDSLKLHYDGLINTSAGHNSSATIWSDISGNSNHGTTEGGSFNTDSISLPGSSSGIVSNNAIAFGTDATFEIAYKRTDTTKNEFLIDARTGDNTGMEPAYHYNSNKIEVYSTTTGSVNFDLPQNDTNIHFLTVVYKAGGGSVYFDGTKLSGSTPTIANCLTNIYIGRRFNAAHSPYKGKIYTVRVYTKALNEAEILSNYNLDFNRFNF